MLDELLINSGAAIKSLEIKGDMVTVGDYGILWGDADHTDLGGDWFTRDTYLGSRKGIGVDCLLHHGIPLSPALKSYSSVLLPATVKAEPDEHGLLVATILDRRNAYERKLFELTEEGAMSWSSGAITRAVKRRDGVKCGEIVQWPIFEFSFTPTPAEFRMTGIRSLGEAKSAPEDWLDNLSYAKAVRVLSDLAPKEEIKAAEETSREKLEEDTEDLRQKLIETDDGPDTWAVIFKALKAGMGVIPDDDGVTVERPKWDEEAVEKIAEPINAFCKFLLAIHNKNNDDEPMVRAAIERANAVLKAKKDEAAEAADDDETKAASDWDFVHQMMTREALAAACDKLRCEVLPFVLSPDAGPQNFGNAVVTPPTRDEKMAYLQSNLDGFTEMIQKMVRMVLELRADETPEQAVKSLRNESPFADDEFKDTKFSEHSQKIVGALVEYQERVEDLIELRSGSRKAGRVLSKSNLERLTKYHSRLKELEDEMADLLEAHAPDDVTNAADTVVAELDSPGVAEKKSLADELAELELAEAERRFAEMNGSALIAAAD